MQINNIEIPESAILDHIERHYLLEVNDAITQQKIMKSVTLLLADLGCTEFYVQCDAMTNTPEIIDAHAVAMDIFADDKKYNIVFKRETVQKELYDSTER